MSFLKKFFSIGGQLLFYNIVLLSAIHQHDSALGTIRPLPLERASASRPVLPLWVVTEHRAELPEGHGKFFPTV